MTSQAPTSSRQPGADETLAAEAQSGGRKAADALIVRYRPFVKMIASRYSGVSLEPDDIVQEGLIGLLSAVYTYSPVRNASFRTYCAACVNNAIRSAVRSDVGARNTPLNSYVPLEALTLPSDDSPEQIVLSDEKTDYIHTLIRQSLSPLENRVLKLHLNGSGYRTTAEALGVSEKAVDNALQRVRKKLADALNEY